LRPAVLLHGDGATKAQQMTTGTASGDQPSTDAMENITPLGRRGTSHDTAGAVDPFCIAESDCASRQTLLCSGGLGGF
jgi:hypothetical protein